MGDCFVTSSKPSTSWTCIMYLRWASLSEIVFYIICRVFTAIKTARQPQQHTLQVFDQREMLYFNNHLWLYLPTIKLLLSVTFIRITYFIRQLSQSTHCTLQLIIQLVSQFELSSYTTKKELFNGQGIVSPNPYRLDPTPHSHWVCKPYLYTTIRPCVREAGWHEWDRGVTQFCVRKVGL